jgi:dipeptidyl aminopeptidase/acylaminoacyl peptidase
MIARFLVIFALMLSARLDGQEPPAGQTARPPEAVAPKPKAGVSATEKAAPAGPRDLTPADYGRWERLGRVSLSPDGRWIAYGVRTVGEETDLRVRMLATDSDHVIEHASGPSFSDDGNWLAYRVGVSAKKREQLTKAKKPVPTRLGLRNLRTGETLEMGDLSGFKFSGDGRYLAISRSQQSVLVRDLKSGTQASFGQVAAYRWSDRGHLLALQIKTKDPSGNAIQLYDPAKAMLRVLDSGRYEFSSMTWREDEDDLAYLRKPLPDDRKSDDDQGKKSGKAKAKKKPDVSEISYHVVTWTGLQRRGGKRTDLTPTGHEGFPEGHRIASEGGLRWSKDGDVLFFGVKKKEKQSEEEAPAGKKKKKSAKDKAERKSLADTLDEAPGVEIWHHKDIDIVPRQKRTLSGDKRRTHLMAWWPKGGKVVRLGTDVTETVRVLEGSRHALGLDNTPYETEKRFGPTLNDVYLIDVATGERKKILSRHKYVFGSDPTGRWVSYVKEGHLWTFDVKSGAHRNLTGDLSTSFINDLRKTLTDEPPPFGIAGWTRGGRELLVHDRYDVWALRPDGRGARRLTRGAERQRRHRVLVLDADQDLPFDPKKPIFVSLYGDFTKRSGFGRLSLDGSLTELCLEDRSVGGLTRAEKSDVLAFTKQGFDDSPDVFVTDASFKAPKQVSATNPWQKDFHWGHSELVDFENAHGQKLQGALHYPANYDPGKKYPMIVYIYELRSQNLHRYQTPSERSAYNPTVFSSEGYFVFQPDIVYRAQNPGLSAVECVVPAVEKVLATKNVDKDRVGLVGHSWGAYQTAFIVTQTDLFAAGIAGAPLTNMMSMSMSIYWNSGQTDAWIFHESQGRMDRPFWRDIDTYRRNSPIFSIDKLTTPLLIAFGDKDGAVDWHQGIEMYNAARLAQKPLVMLVYPGENHGLAKKPNQVDYHYRIKQWFGHYLKGQPARKWIRDGVSWKDQKDALEKKEKKKSR